MEKVFLEMSQNSQASAATLLKKRLWHRCFPVNFATFLRTPFFTEHLWWLPLSSNYLLKALQIFRKNLDNETTI